MRVCGTEFRASIAVRVICCVAGLAGLWLFHSPTALGDAGEETYFVLKIHGDVRLAATGAPLTFRMTLTPTDEIKFASPEDSVALVRPGRGRVTLSAAGATKTPAGEFMAMLKDTLMPPKKSKMMGTRGKIMSHDELTRFFSGGGDAMTPEPLLIIGKGAYDILSPEFPMDEQRFFFIGYEYRGQRINKKLAHNGKTLFIDASLYSVDDIPIPRREVTDMTLNYIDRLNGARTLICRMTPVFADRERIVEELKAVVSAYPNAAPKDIYEQHAYAYLKEYYGEPDPERLREILEQDIGLAF